tara:strand:+ start:866 stop:3466 length:2601 start_codon:yes stop_codon:yes gene_type:complete
MATIYVSPGVFTRELDLSFVPAAVQEIGACLVGPTLAGPAFTPTIINTYDDFRAIYGDTNRELFLPYAAKNYLSQGGSLTVTRVLGTESSTNQGTGYYIRFGGSGLTGSTLGILRLRSGETSADGVALCGVPDNFTLTANGLVASNLSFNQGSQNYITNRVGTDYVSSGTTDELGMFYVDTIFNYNYDTVNAIGIKLNADPTNVAPTEAVTGSVGQASLVCQVYNPDAGADSGAAGVSGVTAGAGMCSLNSSSDPTGTISSPYSNAKTPWVVSQNINGAAQNLFKFHLLESGEGSNTKAKIGIVLQENQVSASAHPKFTVVLRKFNDTDNNPIVLESFSNCNLDKNSSSYIAKVIGDRYPIWANLGGLGSPELTFGGQYDNKSAFVRIEMTTENLQSNHRPSGYSGVPKVTTNSELLESAHVAGTDDTESLSSYAQASIPQLRYKTDNFVSGVIPDPTQFLGIEYDSGDVSGRIAGKVSLGPGSVLQTDPGFMIMRNNSETGSTSAALSAYVGGYINDITGAINKQKSFYHTLYDGTGTAANTAKFYQFTVPVYGGYDGLDQRTKLSTAIKNGALSAAYVDAVDILSNADEYDYNMLAMPGVTNAAVGGTQSRAIDMVTARGDAFFLAELGSDSDGTGDDKTMSVQTAVDKAAGIDSSYAAAWYPWVRIFDPDLDDLVWVPPSIETIGTLAFTDVIADPWFAPAGFNRGGLNNVIEAYRRLTQMQRDTLYEGKVNPIATFAGQGIYVFGQKTLQSASSALDRINVRRMLLYARKLIASASRSILFEQNSMQTRNKLANMINQILRPIKVRQGLTQFRVTIDETNNTPDTIDRNQVIGAIYLQPTKTAEMIILDFNIERTGASFEEA